MDSELKASLVTILGGALVFLVKWSVDAFRGKDRVAKTGRKSCEYGERNREDIADHEADIRVMASQIREAQKQLDEVFSRLKYIEEKVNQILGHVKDHL